MIVELKCRRCDTGLFKVEDIARGLGKLPLRLTCHICGMQYIVKPDENGSPAVFSRKGRERWRKMEIPGLKEIEPAPGPEVTADEVETAQEPAPEPIESAPSPEDQSAAAPPTSQTETAGESPGPATEGTAKEEE